MKLTNRDFAAKARGAAQGCGIFFFCGQDEAGASAAANELVSWLPEPGERVEMSGAELRGDPAKLGDEARTMRIAGALQDNGFDIRGIRPPTVPAGTSRLRVSITLNSEESDIRDLAENLERLL